MPVTLTHPQEQGDAAVGTCAASRTFDAPMPLRLWHLASLDAPTVAVVWALAIAWAGGIRLPAWVPVLLALGTWTVYVGDRLLDARAGLTNGAVDRLRERHSFHWRHRRLLTTLAAAAGMAAAGLIVQLMPMAIQERNAALGAAALLYFSGVHAPGLRRLRLLPKELVVGVLFTAGCALPTLTRMRLAGIPDGTLGWVMALAMLFAALAWLNCCAIEWWESERMEGSSHLCAASTALGCAGVAMAFLLAGMAEPRLAELAACAAGSAGMLGWLDRRRARLSPLALRAAADLVLLTPIVCLMR